MDRTRRRSFCACAWVAVWGLAPLLAGCADEAASDAPSTRTTTSAASSEREPRPLEVSDKVVAVDEAAKGDARIQDPNLQPAAQVAAVPETIPPVLLTDTELKMVGVGVGNSFPSASLQQPSGERVDLASLYGARATVVLLWTKDAWMSQMALEDLASDVARPYADAGVGVVAVGVGQSSSAVREKQSEMDLPFPVLSDPRGEFFASLGSGRLPRLFVLNADGTVEWLDIEYSLSSHRELLDTLTVLLNR